MGGSILVESKPGEGTCFIITLQAKCPKPSSEEALKGLEHSSEQLFVFDRGQLEDESNQSLFEPDADSPTRFRVLLVNDEPF